MELTRYFENPFDNPRLKEGDFRQGAQFHIVSLQVRNQGGIYDAIIAQTVPLFEALDNTIATRGIEYAQQRGSTLMVNKARRALIKLVSVREGLISSTFGGSDSAQYKEFFPYGLREYHKATNEELAPIAQRLVNVAGIYAAELGPGLQTEFEVAKQALVNARASQNTNMAEHSSMRYRTHQARKTLAEQLLRNLYTIGLHNPGKPEVVSQFFDLNLFTPKRGKKKKEGE